jgi:hypothetical protein
MAGYEEAKADILGRGGAVAGYTYADADEGAIMSSGNRRSLWAVLFGGDDEEEARPQRGRTATSARQSQTVAYAPAAGNSDDAGTRSFFSQPTPPAEVAAAPRRPVRGPQVAAIDPRPTPEPDAEPAPVPVRAAAPAPVQPAAPLLANTPQPTLAPAPSPRPVGLALAAIETPSGPRMQWQTGPGGRAIEVQEPASRVALVEAPLPPRRPDDLPGRPAPEAAPVTVAMVAAPVPPARPAELVPAVVASAAPALRGAVAAAEPAPVPAARAVDHPAPPERPVVATTVASVTRQAAPAPAPAPAPAAPASVAISSREAQRPRTDRDELQALFVAVADTSVPAARAPVATARTRQAATPVAVLPSSAPNVVARFGAASPAELRPDRFTGPAVRPLAGSFSRL